jgi:GNAT superfamily N-acetyltransferase
VTRDRERIDAFLRWVHATTSTRMEPSEYGTAFYNDDFPGRWDGNFLRVERPALATAEQLIFETDRLFDGFGHREIVIGDEAAGARLAATFGRDGWEVDRLVFMVRRRDADRASVAGAEECSFEEIRPLIVEANLHSHGTTTLESAEMLADFRGTLVDTIDARFFASRVDGELAGSCELYVHGDVAEIEDVHTLERFRGRGLARAVVGRAVLEAGDRGADLVFLFADDADWPKELYAKLGFDPESRFWQFTKPPAGESYRSTASKSRAAVPRPLRFRARCL